MINFIPGMQHNPPYKIFYISDSAVTIDFGNVIDEQLNKRAIAVFNYLTRNPLVGMIEAIPAYSSVTIYYDVVLLRKKIPQPRKIYEWLQGELHKLMRLEFTDAPAAADPVRIPVCYEKEFGMDLQWMAEQKSISVQEIVRIHTSRRYRVYMLGFLPGFAYMGEVDDQIAIARKKQPQPVVPGSVGIAGKQTGIYPLNSPGGWQIIGRTSLKMFDKHSDELCLLKAGDYVEFFTVTKDEFENYQGGSV
jgi:inhibitor of KinA